jgi:hypothetical protein
MFRICGKNSVSASSKARASAVDAESLTLVAFLVLLLIASKAV